MVRPLLPSRVRTIARETTVVSQGLSAYRSTTIRVMLYRWFYGNHNLIVCQSQGTQLDLIKTLNLPRKKTVALTELEPPVIFPRGTSIWASSVPRAVNCQLCSLVHISLLVK